MRVVSANVNGVRAAVRRGGLKWLTAAAPDILCLQEVRATDAQLRAALAGAFDGWHVLHRPSGVRSGHAGVAVLSRWPIDPGPDLGESDDEGRWAHARIGTPLGALDVVSVYVHTGEADTPAQDDKHRFLAAIGTWMEQHPRGLVCGDINVAHTADDIKNWKGNRGKAGFLESERAHLDDWYGRIGWVDLGRRHHGPGPGAYTWWSWRGKAFDNDAGWRIDVVLAAPGVAAQATGVSIGRADNYDRRWSDHAPVVVDFGP